MQKMRLFLAEPVENKTPKLATVKAYSTKISILNCTVIDTASAPLETDFLARAYAEEL